MQTTSGLKCLYRRMVCSLPPLFLLTYILRTQPYPLTTFVVWVAYKDIYFLFHFLPRQREGISLYQLVLNRRIYGSLCSDNFRRPWCSVCLPNPFEYYLKVYFYAFDGVSICENLFISIFPRTSVQFQSWRRFPQTSKSETIVRSFWHTNQRRNA